MLLQVNDIKFENLMLNWRPPSVSELTPIIFNTELTYLGSETSKYILTRQLLYKY